MVLNFNDGTKNQQQINVNLFCSFSPSPDVNGGSANNISKAVRTLRLGMRDVYYEKKKDYQYTLFKLALDNYENGKGLFLPVELNIDHKYYSLAHRMRQRTNKNFNPNRLQDIKDTVATLKSLGAEMIEVSNEFNDRINLNHIFEGDYDLFLYPDKDILRTINNMTVNKFTYYLNQIMKTWQKEGTDLGFVGKYLYKDWDCYDAPIAGMFAVLNYAQTEKVPPALYIRYGGQWDTADSRRLFGYTDEYAKRLTGPNKKEILEYAKPGMLVWLNHCSNITGTGNHWGVLVNYGSQYKPDYYFVNRSGGTQLRKDSLENMLTNVESDNDVFLFYPGKVTKNEEILV